MRTVLRGMPGVQKKQTKKQQILKCFKSNINQPNEYLGPALMHIHFFIKSPQLFYNDSFFSNRPI